MSLEPITDPEAVPLDLLRRYLAAHGWRQGPDVPRLMPSALAQNQSLIRSFIQARPGGRRNFDIYVLSEEGVEDIEVVLPREQTASDFLRRIEDAIRTLSDVEGRRTQDVVTAVRMIGYDVMRSRIPDTMVHDDTIHLAAAAKYITGIQDLLAATATTEMKPTPFYQRARPAAVEYAAKCRFGHTFRGSFGFTVESPVVPNIEPTLPAIDQSAPFERRVIQRLAHAIRIVCEAVQSDNQASLIADVSKGFSANAYEEFANLLESTSGNEMVFSFSFSPEWNAPKELTDAGDFVVGPRHIEFVRAAAKKLRKQAISRPEILIGRVERLQSEDDPSDVLNPGEREVSVRWLSEDLGLQAVRVSLQATDYLAAIEAHKAGRPIKVSGILEGKGRHWRLVNSSNFSVP